MMILVTGGAASGKSEFAELLAQRLYSPVQSQSHLHELQGKSNFSETQGQGSALIYLATMKNIGREAGARVEKHRRMREGKGFITVELWGEEGLWQQPALLTEEDHWQKPDRIPMGSVVLLEDLSNLLSNLMFPGVESETEAKPGGSGKIPEESGKTLEESGKTPEDSGNKPEESGKTPEEVSKEGSAESIRLLLQGLKQRTSHLVIVTNEVFSDGVSYGRETMDFLRALGSWNQRIAAEANMVFDVVAGIPLLRKSGVRM